MHMYIHTYIHTYVYTHIPTLEKSDQQLKMLATGSAPLMYIHASILKVGITLLSTQNYTSIVL